ncbi:MAG: hypothetical protein H7A44_10070 [Opitutaceae bacterium]|nr:hypothetical protein [Cephaloticoccus sp.]MCP5530774.1 hypothetical protein [Opitutaceae bacterium]
MANPDLSQSLHPTPEAEARQLLETQGEQGLKGAIAVLMTQFNVLQTRAQMMLTITTLTLTITGFSGPKIAASGMFSRVAMAAGLLFTLASTLLILGGSLRIRWVTQFKGDSPLQFVTRVLTYRNAKTRLFFAEICLLVAGLACYVAGVVAYFILGE